VKRYRGSSSQRGYGAAWRKLRHKFLKAHPLCHCGQLATDVDHILAKAKGGKDEWSNLRALCHRCHSAKTASEDGGFGN